MPTIDLRYGKSSIAFDHDAERFEVLAASANSSPMSDVEIGNALDHPIDSPPLEEIVRSGDRVLLVVPDATRQSVCAQIVNLVVRRLIANGSAPSDINIIFATGIHRPVSEEEKHHLLTPFIAQRIQTFTHDAGDALRNFRVGETSTGLPVELNWRLTEYDHVVLIGSVTFHYFAGFTGGRKLICPGLASSRTIEATHRLAFDCETKDRAIGVGTARLKGNPVHEAFEQAAALIDPSFAVMTIVSESGEVTEVHCGHWISSHEQACESYLDSHSVAITEKRDVVIASCGGYPLDINMIQAHKTLEAVSYACNDGGTIVLLAECADGPGRADFLDWFTSKSSKLLADRLCANYRVNGQTAWSLLKKTKKFNVEILTSLSDEEVQLMRMKKLSDLAVIHDRINSNRSGYILPVGSTMHLKLDE